MDNPADLLNDAEAAGKRLSSARAEDGEAYAAYSADRTPEMYERWQLAHAKVEQLQVEYYLAMACYRRSIGGLG
jgi:hypothetical protein